MLTAAASEAGCTQPFTLEQPYARAPPPPPLEGDGDYVKHCRAAVRRDSGNRCCLRRRYQGGGGVPPPPAERRNTTRWPTTEEAVEAAMAET